MGFLSQDWDLGRPAWQRRGSCRDLPTNHFFLDEDCDDRTQERYLPGLAICGFCEVRQECLDYSIKHKIRHGIYGGMTSKQRDRYRYKRKHLKLVSS